MGIAVVAFIAVFALIASLGLLLFYRQAMLQRISSVITPERKDRGVLAAIQHSGLTMGNISDQFEKMLPKNQAETSSLQKRLTQAGYRTDTGVNIFRGIRILLPAFFLALVWITGAVTLISPLVVSALALAIGYLLPDIGLRYLISQRQKKVRRGLPDVLDMLVICIEAGLSLDQATQRTAQELGPSQPILSDELGLVVLEQRAGRPRSEAWKNMAERTGEENVRNLVSMLVQAEQFGTSVAKTLRVHSDTLRTKRVQQIEEAAAKLTVKIIFPLVFFIFPSLFVVTLGPAMITISETFNQMSNH
jgi:tight adherence protein C